VRQLIVSIPQQSVESEVALVMSARSVLAKDLDVIEDALAEPVESYLSELAKDSPVRFR
jgi:hypothetical protein